MDNVYLKRSRAFFAALPHTNKLGVEVVSCENQGVTVRLPYSALIIGNPETGVIHSGALSTVLDTTCGCAVGAYLDEFELCPTLDLRIDHMSQAEANKDIFAFAESYRVTDTVVFVRGYAYQDDRDRPIASCVGTFMRLGSNMLSEEQLKRAKEGFDNGL